MKTLPFSYFAKYLLVHSKLALSLTSIGVSTATFDQSTGGSTYSLFAHFFLAPLQHSV
nr:MAG TPA: hypothetical protein [Caudoviricetes sp.]